jgi:acetylornithine/succinyldiaminopimelate/putrescine aminotransferase
MSLMNTLTPMPGRTFVSGDGSWLVDQRGERVLDFYADTGTASMGYHSPEMAAALRRILDERIPAHSPNVIRHTERDRAAERLAKACGMDKVFFCTSGAEAVEAAMKCARKVQWDRGQGNRVDIYAWRDAFHGRTLATLAAGDGPTYHHTGFGPLPAGFKRFFDIDDIRPDAAAVLLAPVMSNYTLITYPDAWLRDLRAYCDKHNILLIFDEVQTGSGRTGGNITYGQRIGVQADIIAVAKGMAMGLSCGACLARGAAAEAFTPGSHFSTFGGQPTAMVFVNAMLDYLAAPGTIDDINAKGRQLREGLASHLWATNVRGVGMLVGFDIDVDKIVFARECLSRGLLIGAFRPGPGPVKLTPPLNITRAEIAHGLDIMARSYNEVRACS